MAGVKTSEMTKCLAALSDDLHLERLRAEWTQPTADNTPALSDFALFRETYFRTERDRPFATEPFHLEWIDAIMGAIERGERLMILSPPRHGKTALLIHFCIWQIIRNPNIRIVWVAGNQALAEDWLSAIEDELEHNSKLVADFCGPGLAFKPLTRSTKSWSRAQFTVATRTVTGIKSPTMVALGKGSKILSRDTDLIVADDVEDHETTNQPAAREKTRNWWTTELGSRKEAQTAWICIGSRQHPDDLYSHLLDNEAWTSMVFSAHDLACETPEHEYDNHVDCMLWPDRHDYRWLMDQLVASETTGGRALWEMVYLNVAHASSLNLFPWEILTPARNPDRAVGDIPSGGYLIAGLDPAATGYQASFLWAYVASENRLYMVDLENEEGGGIQRARGQIAHWNQGGVFCHHWVVEDNLYRGAISQDEILRRYCSDRDIRVESFRTLAQNKWDPEMGVTSLSSWFESGRIDLPYKDAVSQQKTDMYLRQLHYFTRDAGTNKRRRNHRSDLVMASWFPLTAIRRLRRETPVSTEVNYNPFFAGVTSHKMFQWERRHA